MEFAKSLFEANANDRKGYVGVNNGLKFALVESASDEGEPEVLAEKTGLSAMRSPKPGVPFSALTQSMTPPNITPDADAPYDELGFRIEEEDGPEESSNQLLRPFVEDPSARLQWIAYLEFSHSREEVLDLSWDSLPLRIPLTEKLSQMIKRDKGIPHSLRPQLWLRLTSGFEKKSSGPPYPFVVRESTVTSQSWSKEMEKDLPRILPTNAAFGTGEGPGIPRLRRLVRGIGWLYPDIGYSQPIPTILAHLLLLMEEEETWWMGVAIVEDLLPSTYFTPNFIGVRTDSLVLAEYIANFFPALGNLLKEHDIDVGLIATPWFLSLFASVVHVKILLRLWDLLFAEGDTMIFKFTLALIKWKESSLVCLQNSADVFNFLSDLPASLRDFESLDLDAFESIDTRSLNAERQRAAALLPSANSLFSPSGPRRLKKRETKYSGPNPPSLLNTLFTAAKSKKIDMKNKNVRQTELLIDLHESIESIGRHFANLDPRFADLPLEPDFSVESHALDHAKFNEGLTREREKRAKALIDFERRDDDELGFRKNDLITLISWKDEDCWVGELNGLRGWFPAKFVSVLDERGKEYSGAGDDGVTESVADLVRGSLCPAVKRILEHGIKKPSSTVGPIHPWLFIEEVAAKEVEKDYGSVHSRLVLCKTFRLDEDGRVLSPEELLYRSVETVNRSHTKVQMDVKLRSWVCAALNEDVLHLWLEIISSSTEVVSKWYEPWSFLNSPGWVGLKCELRLLAKFPFNLSLDWELRGGRGEPEGDPTVKKTVRDMLVKHHLFSWNL